MNLTTKAVVMLAILLIVLFYPFGLIWALNTLFPALAIGYGWWEWLAVIVLSLSINGYKGVK